MSRFISKPYKAVLAGWVIFCFLFTGNGFSYAALAEGDWSLPLPGAMVGPSPAFAPASIKGLIIDPHNPMHLDFLIDQGEAMIANKADAYRTLVKYFLAALTVPEKDLWVNLSPYEKNRIIPDSFGQTEMGRDLLAQDYVLKQLTASLIYPEKQLGQAFWQKVYAQAQQQFGTTDIPVNTFNKVWIVPDRAVVYQKGDTAFIVDSHLKVMLEEDYLALQKNNTSVIARSPKGDEAVSYQTIASPSAHNNIHALASRAIRQLILPAIEREVNYGQNFALLRQINNALILAIWYKKALRTSLLGKIYADRNRTGGIGYNNHNDVEAIYSRYLQAFKKGVYNYIKEEPNPLTGQTISRKYFSGGYSTDYAQTSLAQRIEIVSQCPDSAMKGNIDLATFHLNAISLDALKNKAKETKRLPNPDEIIKPVPMDQVTPQDWQAIERGLIQGLPAILRINQQGVQRLKDNIRKMPGRKIWNWDTIGYLFDSINANRDQQVRIFRLLLGILNSRTIVPGSGFFDFKRWLAQYSQQESALAIKAKAGKLQFPELKALIDRQIMPLEPHFQLSFSKKLDDQVDIFEFMDFRNDVEQQVYIPHHYVLLEDDGGALGHIVKEGELLLVPEQTKIKLYWLDFEGHVPGFSAAAATMGYIFFNNNEVERARGNIGKWRKQFLQLSAAKAIFPLSNAVFINNYNWLMARHWGEDESGPMMHRYIQEKFGEEVQHIKTIQYIERMIGHRLHAGRLSDVREIVPLLFRPQSLIGKSFQHQLPVDEKELDKIGAVAAAILELEAELKDLTYSKYPAYKFIEMLRHIVFGIEQKNARPEHIEANALIVDALSQRLFGQKTRDPQKWLAYLNARMNNLGLFHGEIKKAAQLAYNGMFYSQLERRMMVAHRHSRQQNNQAMATNLPIVRTVPEAMKLILNAEKVSYKNMWQEGNAHYFGISNPEKMEIIFKNHFVSGNMLFDWRASPVSALNHALSRKGHPGLVLESPSRVLEKFYSHNKNENVWLYHVSRAWLVYEDNDEDLSRGRLRVREITIPGMASVLGAMINEKAHALDVLEQAEYVFRAQMYDLFSTFSPVNHSYKDFTPEVDFPRYVPSEIGKRILDAQEYLEHRTREAINNVNTLPRKNSEYWYWIETYMIGLQHLMEHLKTSETIQKNKSSATQGSVQKMIDILAMTKDYFAYLKTNAAMNVSPQIPGGIDLTRAAQELQVRQDPQAPFFTGSPQGLARLSSISGLMPVVVSITPVKDLPGLLGLRTN